MLIFKCLYPGPKG